MKQRGAVCNGAFASFRTKGGYPYLFMITSTVEWHSLTLDPYDLPDAYEQILTTTENINGERRIRTDIYLKYTNDGFCWCTYSTSPGLGIVSEEMVWEPVIAWAYLPEPYQI